MTKITSETRKSEQEAKEQEFANQKAIEAEQKFVQTASQKIKEAQGLLNKGVGGIGSTVALKLPGKATKTDTLESVYGTLQSLISLDKLKELKESSATGASGLGALSEKELQLLLDSVARLDPELPNNVQAENLKTVSTILGIDLGGASPDIDAEIERLQKELGL
jgi:hypothetical protein